MDYKEFSDIYGKDVKKSDAAALPRVAIFILIMIGGVIYTILKNY